MAEGTDHIDAAIARKAHRQFGLITIHQARTLGLTDRMRRRRQADGRLVRRGGHTFAVASAPDSWRQRLLLAQYEAGRGAVISHASAAVLWGFHGFGEDESAGVELTLPYPRRATRSVKATVHRSRRLDAADLRRKGPLRLTARARTLLDIAPGLSTRRLHDIVDVACRDGQISVAHVQRRLDALRGPGLPGVARLAEVLAEPVGPSGRRPGSWLEREVFELLVAAGLPAPERQVELQVDGHTSFVDLLYREAGLALEPEGGGTHSSDEDRTDDARRTARLTRLGLQVLPITFVQVTQEPEQLVAEIRAILAARTSVPLR